LQTVLEQLDAVRMVLRQHRVVAAEPLDEAAVTGCGRLGDDDPIEGTLFRAAAGEANLQGHVLSTPGELRRNRLLFEPSLRAAGEATQGRPLRTARLLWVASSLCSSQ